MWNHDNWYVYIISRIFFFLVLVTLLIGGFDMAYHLLNKVVGMQLSFRNFPMDPDSNPFLGDHK